MRLETEQVWLRILGNYSSILFIKSPSSWAWVFKELEDTILDKPYFGYCGKTNLIRNPIYLQLRLYGPVATSWHPSDLLPNMQTAQQNSLHLKKQTNLKCILDPIWQQFTTIHLCLTFFCATLKKDCCFKRSLMSWFLPSVPSFIGSSGSLIKLRLLRWIASSWVCTIPKRPIDQLNFSLHYHSNSDISQQFTFIKTWKQCKQNLNIVPMQPL